MGHYDDWLERPYDEAAARLYELEQRCDDEVQAIRDEILDQPDSAHLIEYLKTEIGLDVIEEVMAAYFRLRGNPDGLGMEVHRLFEKAIETAAFNRVT